MNLRQARRAFRLIGKRIEIVPVVAKSEFQKKRITESISLAKMYLEGDDTIGQMASLLGVTQERVAQVVRLGIKYLAGSGRLQAGPCSKPSSSSTTRGRGRG